MLTGPSKHIPRHARRSAPRRLVRRRPPLAVTAPGLALITIAIVAALAGCSGSTSGSAASAPAAGQGTPQYAGATQNGALAAPAAAASASSSAAAASGETRVAAGGGAAQSDSATRLVPGDHQLIYTAQLTVRARDVGTALSRAESIVTAAGGYVSAENSNGGSGQSGAAASASVTLKIPAAAYQVTLGELTGTGLGTQLDLSQQAQDVTQQVADVSSRVASDEAAITQLRALLKDTGSVGGLLSVQDQINSEESDLESMLAQQQALNHETAYATVSLTILGPKAPAKAKAKHKPVPPPGLASGLAGGWRAFRLSVDWLLAIIGSVAPFAAVVVVIGGAVWWARRRLARGASAAGRAD
ncbi:MAG: DUF4349 domain-containing protein [Trebonia sp.]|jgi:hypothetical protein